MIQIKWIGGKAHMTDRYGGLLYDVMVSTVV